MKFTIIIPCFLASRVIARALDSLVIQTYTNFDVVIIDDASPDFDEAASVIELFKDKLDIQVVRNSVNSNGAFARNRGIETASGDYVAFLDADDSWVETRLESAKKQIENLHDNNFVIYGKFELIQKGLDGALLPLRAIKSDELVTEYVFAAAQPMQTSTFICPVAVAREVMFDEHYSRHQDTDFMMRAQKSGASFIFQEQKCSHYYFNSSVLVERIAAMRMNTLFCERWMRDKVAFFNARSLAGYKLIVYSRVLYIETYKCLALLTAFKSVWRIGVLNLIDLIKIKIYTFLKRW